MIDYIMRLDALIDVCIGCNEEFPNEPCEPNDCKIKRALSGIPTADVQENVKGEWLPHPNKDFREWDVCSACGVGCKRREYELGIAGMEYMTEYNYPYCPNCGADMRPISALSENVEIVSNLKRGES